MKRYSKVILGKSCLGRPAAMWNDDFEPRELCDVCGHGDVIKRIASFLSNYGERNKKALLLYGENGIGKSLLANLVPKHEGYSVRIATQHSDLKQTHAFRKIFDTTPQNKIVVVYDAMYVSDQSGDARHILNATRPTIIVADVREFGVLSVLRKQCIIVRVRPPSLKDLRPLIKRVGIAADSFVYRNDVRSTLLNAQMNLLNCRDDAKIADPKKALVEFADHNTSRARKEWIVENTADMPKMVFDNYTHIRIKPDATQYAGLRQTVERGMLTHATKKAREQYKKKNKGRGKATISIARPKLSPQTLNDMYKMTVYVDVLEKIGQIDAMTESMLSTQNYGHVPYINGLVSTLTDTCNGALAYESINKNPYRYTRTESTRDPLLAQFRSP